MLTQTSPLPFLKIIPARSFAAVEGSDFTPPPPLNKSLCKTGVWVWFVSDRGSGITVMLSFRGYSLWSLGSIDLLRQNLTLGRK